MPSQIKRQSTRCRAGNTRPARHRGAPPTVRLLPVAVLLALLGLQPIAGGRDPKGPMGVREASAWSAGGNPFADWLEDLTDQLDDIANDLDDARIAVGESQGPLSEPDLSQVEGDLDGALATIALILDPQQYPSLDPVDAGEIDYSASATTLPAYAAKCLTLAEEALAEAQYGAADDRYIGSRLKTIEYLITRSSPHNYRTKAGIE